MAKLEDIRVGAIVSYEQSSGTHVVGMITRLNPRIADPRQEVEVFWAGDPSHGWLWTEDPYVVVQTRDS